MAAPLAESFTAALDHFATGFDNVELEGRERRRSGIRRLLTEAVDLHLSPVHTRVHIDSVGRLLNESYVDYAIEELDEMLTELIASDMIGSDRFGRVLPRCRRSSPIEIAQTFKSLKDLAAQLADTEPMRGYDVSFSSRDLVLSHDILSMATELKLVRRAACDDRDAINELVVRNMRLVAHLSRSYYGYVGAMDRDDFLQEGAIGLIRAAEKFDPERGFRFSTYATWWIRQATRRAASDKGRTIRIPVHADDRLRPLLAFVSKYREEAATDPSRAEIAAALKLDRSEVEWLLDLPAEIYSLEETRSKALVCWHHERTDSEFEEITVARSRSSVLRQAIANLLSDKQKTVIVRRFGLLGSSPETLDEIGKDLRITRERVRQLQEASLKILRLHLGPALR